MIRSVLSALALAALVAPGAARAASVTVEGQYGISRPPSADVNSAIGGVTTNLSDLAESSLQVAGGDVLLSFGGFQIGAVADTTFGDGVTQTAVGGLFGFRIGDELRLDLLGEVGGQRYGNVLEDQSIVTASSTSEWLLYVGVRPGVAYRFDVVPGSGIVLGVWGFARWDLTDATVDVNVGDTESPASIDLGGTTIGATLRLGVEF